MSNQSSDNGSLVGPIIFLSVIYCFPMIIFYSSFQGHKMEKFLKDHLPRAFSTDGFLIFIRKTLTVLAYILWPVTLVFAAVATLAMILGKLIKMAGQMCIWACSYTEADSCCGVRLNKKSGDEEDALPLNPTRRNRRHASRHSAGSPPPEEHVPGMKWNKSANLEGADMDSSSIITAPPAYPGAMD